MFDSIYNFISYWYFRYLLVTELYMVEKWERAVIHIFFLIVFTLLSLFNVRIILPMTSYIANSTMLNNFNTIVEEVEHSIHSEL